MSEIILNKVANPPSTPGAGEISISVNASGEAQITDGDTTLTKTFKSIYGTNLNTATKQVLETVTTTTGSSYLIMPITVTADNVGFYIFYFNYYWGYSTTGRDYIGEIRVNGVPNGEIHREETKDAGTDQRHSVSGFRILNLGVGVHNVELFCKVQTDGDTGRTYQCNFMSHRVS